MEAKHETRSQNYEIVVVHVFQ